MKIKEDIKNLTTSQSNLARCLGLTQPRINQLIEEGVVVRDYKDPNGGVMLFQSIKNWYQSKKATDDGADYWTEKAKREKVNRKRDELRLRKEEGSAYDAQTVELAFIEILTVLRTQLLGLPSKIAAALPADVRGEVCDTLTQEIENRLIEISEYDPKSLSREIKAESEE